MNLQLLAVKRRLLASVHSDLIDESVRVHGWDRADIELALARAGNWKRLNELFQDWQRQHRSPSALSAHDKGRYFHGYVICNTRIP